jgi:hypothetical protein
MSEIDNIFFFTPTFFSINDVISFHFFSEGLRPVTNSVRFSFRWKSRSSPAHGYVHFCSSSSTKRLREYSSMVSMRCIGVIRSDKTILIV